MLLKYNSRLIYKEKKKKISNKNEMHKTEEVEEDSEC